jgi:hypothetical protein
MDSSRRAAARATSSYEFGDRLVAADFGPQCQPEVWHNGFHYFLLHLIALARLTLQNYSSKYPVPVRRSRRTPANSATKGPYLPPDPKAGHLRLITDD